MARLNRDWRWERRDEAPSDFPFALLVGNEPIAWFKRSIDAEFVVRAVPEIVQLRQDLVAAAEEARQRTGEMERRADEVERVSRAVNEVIADIARLAHSEGTHAALERASQEAIRELGRLTRLVRRRAA